MTTLTALIVKSVEHVLANPSTQMTGDHICGPDACSEWRTGLAVPGDADAMIMHCMYNPRTVHVCSRLCKYVVVDAAEDIAVCSITSLVVVANISKSLTRKTAFQNSIGQENSRVTSKRWQARHLAHSITCGVKDILGAILTFGKEIRGRIIPSLAIAATCADSPPPLTFTDYAATFAYHLPRVTEDVDKCLSAFEKTIDAIAAFIVEMWYVRYGVTYTPRKMIFFTIIAFDYLRTGSAPHFPHLGFLRIIPQKLPLINHLERHLKNHFPARTVTTNQKEATDFFRKCPESASLSAREHLTRHIRAALETKTIRTQAQTQAQAQEQP